jgi:hypothetical protein
VQLPELELHWNLAPPPLKTTSSDSPWENPDQLTVIDSGPGLIIHPLAPETGAPLASNPAAHVALKTSAIHAHRNRVSVPDIGMYRTCAAGDFAPRTDERIDHRNTRCEWVRRRRTRRSKLEGSHKLVRTRSTGYVVGLFGPRRRSHRASTSAAVSCRSGSSPVYGALKNPARRASLCQGAPVSPRPLKFITMLIEHWMYRNVFNSLTKKRQITPNWPFDSALTRSLNFERAPLVKCVVDEGGSLE